jgi:hypothetical protein
MRRESGISVARGRQWITPTLLREEIRDTYDGGLGPETTGFGRHALDHRIQLIFIR